MTRVWISGFVSIGLLVAGQSLLKHGLNVAGGTSLLEQGIVGTLQRIVSQPFVPAGFVCYAVSSLLWLDVLSKLEISKAYPLVSLSYVFTLLIGLLVFRDQIGWIRLVGVGLICAGVALVAQS